VLKTNEQIKVIILQKLFYKQKIGKSHTAPQTVLRRIKFAKDPDKALRELIRDNLVLTHPTSYGPEISLNPKRIDEIKNMIL
jgi:hypothetical protein